MMLYTCLAGCRYSHILEITGSLCVLEYPNLAIFVMRLCVSQCGFPNGGCEVPYLIRSQVKSGKKSTLTIAATSTQCMKTCLFATQTNNQVVPYLPSWNTVAFLNFSKSLEIYPTFTLNSDNHRSYIHLTMASGKALPPTSPYFKNMESKHVNDPWQKAYKTCLQYEAQAKLHVDHIRPRMLGYLIREAPYDESRDRICWEINSCNGENATLQDLADMYIQSLIQVCKYQAPFSPFLLTKIARPFISETNILFLTIPITSIL